MKRTPLRRFSKRARENARELDRMRPLVAERSGGQCEVEWDGQRCWARSTEVHHVLSRAHGGGNELDNLRALCGVHHVWIHSHPAEAAHRGLIVMRKP